MTLDKLASLPGTATYLREGIMLGNLRKQGCALTGLRATDEFK